MTCPERRPFVRHCSNTLDDEDGAEHGDAAKCAPNLSDCAPSVESALREIKTMDIIKKFIDHSHVFADTNWEMLFTPEL